MTLTGRIRERAYASSIDARERAYASVTSEADRERQQLELLNREWTRVLREVPYYRALGSRGEVPAQFDTLDAFVATVPPMTRADVQSTLGARTSEGRRADFRRITGGSTAEPVQLPAWNDEMAHLRIDLWLARRWYRISPASRCFFLWGHSHLLGTGLGGWVKARRMEWSDRLLGYYRHSAYDMRPERLKEAARAMLAFRPDYMLGYSVALERFALANADAAEALGALGLRAVLGAAEAFPSEDGPARLENMFRCPVAMEYGAVETNLIAHTAPEGGYRVFWRSYFVDVTRHHAGWRVHVTSLFPRAFPLVRYDMGDEVELEPADTRRPHGLARLRRVYGRCNDYVVLEDGAVVHSEAFTHAVRSCPEVQGYQVVQRGAAIRVRYLASRPLSADAERGIRDRLARIHARLGDVALERAADLSHTIAGKTRMVVVEP